MLKGLVILGFPMLALMAVIGLAWAGILEMTQPFSNLESLTTPIVTSTSSGIWFLILAVAGWRASMVRPAAARAKTH